MSDEGLDFKTAVLALDGGCICGLGVAGLGALSQPCEGYLQAHHVITQQQLRTAGLNDYRWDPQNGAAVCERHHRRHHNRKEPITQAMLPQRCRDFAAKHFLTVVLDRYYPDGED